MKLILRKETSERTAEEFDYLEQRLESLELLKKLKKKKGLEIYRNCINGLKYEEYSNSDELYNRESDGNICPNFYILLSGQVRLMSLATGAKQTRKPIIQATSPKSITFMPNSPISTTTNKSQLAGSQQEPNSQTGSKKFQLRISQCIQENESSDSEENEAEKSSSQAQTNMLTSQDISPLRYGFTVFRAQPGELSELATLQPICTFGDVLKHKK